LVDLFLEPGHAFLGVLDFALEHIFTELKRAGNSNGKIPNEDKKGREKENTLLMQGGKEMQYSN
jgi:hypothetical protein